MSTVAAKQDAYEYVLDMLDQLACLARSEALEQLADRIVAVVAAERADVDAGSRSPSRDT